MLITTGQHRILSLRKSSASAPRAQGLAAVFENPLAEPVRDDFVETAQTSSESEKARQRLVKWARTPRISHPVGLYSGLGRCRGWKRTPSNGSSRQFSPPMSRATAA